MGTVIRLDGSAPIEPRQEEMRRSRLAECERGRAQFLYPACDERGRRVWFLKVQCSGLYTRFYGPFPRKREALACFDDVLNQVLRALCDLGNHVTDYPRGHEVIHLPRALHVRKAEMP